MYMWSPSLPWSADAATERAGGRCSASRITGDVAWETLVAPHPLLSVAQLERQALEQPLSSEQRRAWRGLLRALATPRRRVSAVAVGGSVPSGTTCVDRALGLPRGSKDQERACAYPSRFARWLWAVHCRSSATTFFANRALGGTTTAGALPMLPLMVADVEEAGQEGDKHGRAADMLLVDFAVNDHYAEQDWGTSPRDSTRSAPSRAWAVEAATEVLLRHVLSSSPHTAVLLYEGTCITNETKLAHERIARRYGVPFVSYGDALSECSRITTWTAAHAHPSLTTHRYLADALAFWWRAFARRLQAELSTSTVDASLLHPSRSAPISEPTLLRRYEICEAVREYDAMSAWQSRAASSSALAATSAVAGVELGGGNWALNADRLGKPGWIGSEQNSSLHFALSVGASPRATLVFERSYTGFGTARVDIFCHGQRHDSGRRPTWRHLATLDGLRRDGKNVTLASVETVNLRQKGVLPHSNCTLRLTISSDAPLKFKLRHVSSC